MLTPRLDLKTEDAFKAEVTRLGFEINKVVSQQELAWIKDKKKILRGVEEKSALTIRCNMCKNNESLYGWYLPGKDLIQLNVSADMSWGRLVETLCHELCHRMRPWDEIPQHSREFWALLNSSLRACYGVGIPPFPKGQQWKLDNEAVVALKQKYDWAHVAPRKKIVNRA